MREQGGEEHRGSADKKSDGGQVRQRCRDHGKGFVSACYIPRVYGNTDFFSDI